MNFSAAQTGSGVVTLTWDDPGEPSITVYQHSQDGGANWNDINGSDPTTTSHVVSGLTAGTSYNFQVRAVNGHGNSRPSDTARVTVVALPAVPTGLSETPRVNEVTLRWNDPGDDTITGYQYQQKVGTGDFADWEDIPNSGPRTTRLAVTGLAESTEYAFKVRAANIAGNGPASDDVTTTTMTPNSPPTFPSETADRSVPENSGGDTDLGEPVAATDEDNDTLTYSLGGTDAGSFTIESSTGQIKVAAGVSLD